MENGQEETKVEKVQNDVDANESKCEKPVSNAEEKAAEQKVEEPSKELLQKIKNQIEFYFGDVNMQRDKFLIEQTKLDDGWIPMNIMLNFKMLASLSKDIDVILKAVELSDIMEISEDKKKIRRSPEHPLPVYNEEYRKAQEAKTVYIKGFPLSDTNIEKLKTFFNDFEPFENIVMRKYLDKDKKLQFKGSIFVQFKTLEDAKAFMARDSIKFGETELIKKWSADYSVEKAKEREDKKQKKAEGKSKKSENAKDKEDEQSGEEEEENGKEVALPKGCVIHFSGVPKSCTREDIKERLGELDASIAFVDFKIGDEKGWVRLQGENAAKAVVDKMKDSKVLIRGKHVTCRILEGEEEEKYLIKAQGEMSNQRQKYPKGKKSKRGRYAQRGQRKRRNSDSADSAPAKKTTVE